MHELQIKEETPHTLLSLSFIPLSYRSPSFSLPAPSPLYFPFCVPLSPSRRSFKPTRVVPPGLVPGVLLYIATSIQASQPAGGGATFGDTRLDTGLNRLQQQVSPLSGCPVLSFAVSVLVAHTKLLRSRRSMGGRLSQNLNNGWALSRNRVSGGGCLPCTYMYNVMSIYTNYAQNGGGWVLTW